MKTTSDGWYQVVIDPDDERLETLINAARLAADSDPTPIRMNLWLVAKMWVGEHLHPLVHHYVPMKEWDEASRRVIATDYLTCLWCSRTIHA